MSKRSLKDVKALSRRAFELFDHGLSFEEVATQLDVSSRTVRRWVASRDDADALTEDDRHSNSGTATPERMSLDDLPEYACLGADVDELIPDCLKVLRDILKDEDSKTSDRLRAISLILDWSGLSGGFQGSIRRVIECGYAVLDPHAPVEQGGQRTQGLTEEGANLIRAKLLGIE
jgi:hypothetical protein